MCFTVSETEKALIDAVSACSNLRRSALLTQIVTNFVAATVATKDHEPARKELLAFLKECREAVAENPQWMKGLPLAELERKFKQ